MRLLPRLASLWTTLFRRDALERDLDDELRAAISTLAARHAASGMDAASARRRAAADIGGVVRVKEDVLDGRIGAGLDALLLDVRYAWRGLLKARGFTAVVVVTLALGIGATAAISSVVSAMLVRPLPYRDADRLAFVWLERPLTPGYPRGPMSGPDLRDLRTRSRAFESFGGISASGNGGAVALTGDPGPEQLPSAIVTTNFFDVLGASAAIGRTFRPEDSARGARPTIVIGWDLFERRFGGDRSMVGRTIAVNDRAATLVGVMPEDFRLLLPPEASVPDRLQAFVPFWSDLESGPRRNLFLRVIGRMRPGVTIADAREDAAAIGRAVGREIGAGRPFAAVALRDENVRPIRGSLLALFAAVGMLLAIACVNVASLLVARAASRTQETALRLALGASRGRLLRQWLVEGFVLTALGVAAGLACGSAGLRLLLALRPESLARLEASRIDGGVLTLTVAIAAAWGLLFALAPMTELPRRPIAGTTAAHAGRTRTALVVVQIAMSVVLLVGAGLLVRAFVEIVRVDPGFRADGRLTFRLAITGRHEDSEDAFNLFAGELERRLAALPGVTAAGAISHLPYDDLPNWALPYGFGAPPLSSDAPMADARAVSPGIFSALGVDVVAGRALAEDDRDPARPAVLVDDMFARQLWPDGSPLGRRFTLSAGAKRVTVVGVVRHLKLRSLVDALSPQVIVPWRIVQRNPIAFVVRSTRDPASLVPEIRATVASLDPRLPIYDVRPLQDYVDGARSTRRFTMLLAAAFAASALLLASVGVYGVLAYAVARRRREFGVRRALGAGAAQVVREVLRQGLGCAAVGIPAGLAAAAAAARLLRSQLYGVDPHDPATYAAAAALVAAGALAACAVPALRATSVSPMDALRTE